RTYGGRTARGEAGGAAHREDHGAHRRARVDVARRGDRGGGGRRRQGHVERVEEGRLRGGGGGPGLEVRQGRAARRGDHRRGPVPETTEGKEEAMSDTWPPPQFEAPDDPRFSSPQRWRRGHPIEPRSMKLSDVIEGAANLYRMHWKALMGFVAILVVPVQFLDESLN